MKVGIICASDNELLPFISHIENVTIESYAMLSFYCGNIKNMNVVALYSGVCKVNAAIACQLLIDKYGVNIVINAGAAGAISNKLNIFDTVISEEIAYHDVEDEILTEFHPFMSSNYFHSDERLLEAAKRVANNNCDYIIYFGRSVTGESFIADEGREQIKKKYDPLSVDMETASIAHVCYVNKIPFIAVRTITDSEENSGSDIFEENCEKASKIAKDITLAILDEIDITLF